MGKILSYKLLGTALKSLSDACFKADEQQRNGEVITACGMSDDDLDKLCDIIPAMLNDYMTNHSDKTWQEYLAWYNKTKKGETKK